jgi:hypothetical protein
MSKTSSESDDDDILNRSFTVRRTLLKHVRIECNVWRGLEKKKEKEDDVFEPASNKRSISSQAYVDVDQIFSEGFLDHIVTDFLKWDFSFALYSPSSQSQMLVSSQETQTNHS